MCYELIINNGERITPIMSTYNGETIKNNCSKIDKRKNLQEKNKQ